MYVIRTYYYRKLRSWNQFCIFPLLMANNAIKLFFLRTRFSFRCTHTPINYLKLLMFKQKNIYYRQYIYTHIYVSIL